MLSVSIIALKKADEGITTYESLTRDTNLGGRLQANMLMVRMNVLGWFNTKNDTSLNQYKVYLDKINGFLEQTKNVC